MSSVDWGFTCRATFVDSTSGASYMFRNRNDVASGYSRKSMYDFSVSLPQLYSIYAPSS